MKRKSMKHAYIPDTQITPTSDVRHIKAAGNYLADKQPQKIIIAGDWWDMPSLCSYDRPGSHGWEDKDVKADFECGKNAMDMFLRAVRKPRGYNPEIHITLGNHEERVVRAANDPDNRKFKGYLSTNAFELTQFKVQSYPFLEVVELDGILYSHYFVNPNGLLPNPIGGTIENKLKQLGHSFTMGHQQTKQYGSIYTALGIKRSGLVCGRFYSEEPDYLGPQKSRQSWSGIFLKHEVSHGDYDLMEVSMNFLLDEYL